MIEVFDYDYFLSKGQDELILLFKEFHLRGKTGHGDLFARIIVKLQFLTGFSNKELANELDVSKGLISQAKSYLRLASPRLVKWVKQNSLAINPAYAYARIEAYREYDNYIPKWVGNEAYRLRQAPPWIIEIFKKAEPHYEYNPSGPFIVDGIIRDHVEGFWYFSGYVVPIERLR